MNERRNSNMVRGVFIPIFVALVIGVASSYVATKVMLSVLQEKVGYIEGSVAGNIISVQSLLTNIHQNQIAIASISAFKNSHAVRLAKLEATQDGIRDGVRDRYTRQDAIRDFNILNEKIDLLTR